MKNNNQEWSLPNGEIVPRSRTNSHHVFYPGYEYQNKVDRRMRNLGLFVIRMHMPIHEALHENVPPPPKIGHDLKHIIIQENEYMNKELPQSTRLELITYHLMRLADHAPSQQIQEESDALYHNLIHQLDYIHKGKVQWHQ
jgi:hypothetical protein